jgi:hypothetical protein
MEPQQNKLDLRPERPELRPDLEKAIEDILGLRALHKTTGFATFKSQRDILNQLTPSDQAVVGRILAQREKEAK